MNLPARVRITRLPAPPGDALRAQLRRLAGPDAARLDRLSEVPSDEVVCLVVIAGGKTIGFLLGEREGEEWRETLVVEAAWRGRGIEAAVREELRGEGRR